MAEAEDATSEGSCKKLLTGKLLLSSARWQVPLTEWFMDQGVTLNYSLGYLLQLALFFI